MPLNARKRSALLLTIVVVLIVSMSNLFHTYPVHASMPYVVHSPIQITGNSGFTQANGVTGGSGTRSDPYRIEGWSIAAPSGQASIRVDSTTAHFLILHVQLLNAQPGVYLTSVTNGFVENSTLTNSNPGIRIDSSTNVTIVGNNVSGYGDYSGVFSADILSAPQTTGLTIMNNTFASGGVAVDSSQSSASKLHITGNTFLYTSISTSSLGATVDQNKITGGGLTVEGNNSLVSYNSISGGDITIYGSGTTIRDNSADRILLYAATAATLSNNVLTRGLLIPTYPPFDTPPFYDSHTMIGNTVNGKPVLYLARCSGASIDGAPAAEVIIASCTNVSVANLRLSLADGGIMMVYVHQSSIVGNSLSGKGTNGISVLHSSNLQISRNNFNTTTVTIANTDNVTLTSNLATGVSTFPMLTISGGSNISVWNNTFEGNQGGQALGLANITNATLAQNWISDSGYGVFIDGANGLNITANNLVRNGVGLSLGPGSPNGIFNCLIYHNNFVDNIQHQAVFMPPVVTAFDNGYPSGGNYWSDYRGVDKCSGPQQNICSSPDGIGDTPYAGIWEQFSHGGGVLGNLLDRYPLANPYGNFTWDTASPSWPSGSNLAVSFVNSTSLTLKWTGASDDTWVSAYRIYMDGVLLANIARVQNYTVAHLSPGSTHLFKVEAGDPGRNWSTSGPSATATLPQQFFTISWWTEHWYFGILAGGLPALVAIGIVLIKRKKKRTQPDQRV